MTNTEAYTDPSTRMRIMYCIEQFRHMGATEQDCVYEYYRLRSDPEYLDEWLITLGYTDDTIDRQDR